MKTGTVLIIFLSLLDIEDLGHVVFSLYMCIYETELYLVHNFRTTGLRALIFHMYITCGKSFSNKPRYMALTYF